MESLVNDAEHLWKEASTHLREQVSEAVWLSTFVDAHAEAGDHDDDVVLVVPSDHARDRIQTRYLPLVREAFDEVGAGTFDIIVRTRAADYDDFDEPANELTHNDHHGTNQHGTNHLGTGVAPNAPDDAVRYLPGLNAGYTFETFVKGASNQFALAAALRVAEVPARSYNPLFIYGAAGLGKTHLLHAIGHYVHQNYAHYQVRYVSTEAFMNEYVDAIRTNSTTGFKRRYRDADVLLIDDIQFMEGKEGLQEEFFHTFNALHGANKQIIISSDRMPDAIPTLEDRLRGRFRWGLITDIQPPDLETRLAILRNKAERDVARVPAEVLEFIATHITNNIRELEGALIRVSAFASLNRVPITVSLAERQLGDLLSAPQQKTLSPAAMLDTIAAFFSMPVEQLKGKSRQRPLVVARQVGMYVMRELTDLSYPAIAREFGGRDHTTVIHAVEKVQRMMSERHQIYDQVIELLQRLKKAP